VKEYLKNVFFKNRKNEYYAGLDIGTTKVCSIIGEMTNDNQLSVLGVGYTPSIGLKRGIVINMEKTIESIQQAMSKAESQANIDIEDVYVGIAGEHIRCCNSKGIVEVDDKERGVQYRDIERAIENAKKLTMSDDLEIINAIPQEFVCDEQPHIQDPTNIACQRLEVKMHIVLGSRTMRQNVLKCVEQARCNPKEVLLQSLASSLATVQDKERELGCLLLDIGGGTTDVAVFTNGGISHSSVIAYGGDYITNDIAIVLRIPHTPDAEDLKKKYGCAFVPLLGAEGW